MARIERFVQKTLDRVSLHAPISADLIAYELDGRKLLQINTSGSASRQIPGKSASQFNWTNGQPGSSTMPCVRILGSNKWNRAFPS